MAQNMNFNMAAATILDFVDYGSDGHNYSQTSFSVSVSKMVQIPSKIAEL